MFAKAGTQPLAEIWRIATSPRALATYDVTFVTACPFFALLTAVASLTLATGGRAH